MGYDVQMRKMHKHFIKTIYQQLISLEVLMASD